MASGANETLDEDRMLASLNRLTVGPATVVITGFEVPDRVVVAAAIFARERGLRLVCNPAPARELAAELLDCEPILTPNRSEAKALTGAVDPGDAARALHQLTGAPVIVTMGGAGLRVVTAGLNYHVPVPRVESVDTTGAGDTFNGCLAAELSQGTALRRAASTAASAAAMSVTKSGAHSGMPTRAALDAFVRGNHPSSTS